VSRPASVANTYLSSKRPTGELHFKILKFSDRAPSSKLTGFKRRDPSGIIPPIFKTPECVQYWNNGRSSTYDADDTAHLALQSAYQSPRDAEAYSTPEYGIVLAAVAGKMSR
jgi:hypothetical protein